MNSFHYYTGKSRQIVNRFVSIPIVKRYWVWGVYFAALSLKQVKGKGLDFLLALPCG
jgi:hypothetical protein